MAAPSGSTGANRQSLPFLPTIPKENPTEVWLDLQGPGPAPSRDHHQLILKANDQIVWRMWKINNANKHGLGPTPTEEEYTHAQYKEEDRLQDDIARVFGKETTEYIADLLNGKIDYLPRLPSKILLNIVQYLYLEDLYNLCLSSRQLSKLWNSSELWEYFYKKYSPEPLDKAKLEQAKKLGWKDMFMSKGYATKLRELESRAMVFPPNKPQEGKEPKGS